MREQLHAAVADASAAALDAGDLQVPPGGMPAIEIEHPARPEHGDFATNIAMRLAPVVRASPLQIAERLRERLTPPDGVAQVSVERPGFLNFRLDPVWVARQVEAIHTAGPRYGTSDLGVGERVNVEFISANPTGPLHIGNGRGAFVGGTLASVLESAGWQVGREYYTNDFGGQIREFGDSVYRARTRQGGEGGYRGAYIQEIADQLPAEVLAAPDPVEAIGSYAWNRVLDDIKRTVARIGVRIDVWKSERELHETGRVAAGLDKLRQAGHLYEADGALWFRSTTFGDDRDRVLIRSDGRPTYAAADVAYLLDKFERGFERLIYVLGPDHHGYVARLRGAAAALGFDPERVEVLIYQHVRLVRDGVDVSMSKRAGTFVTLDELIDEVGADAVRFFFAMRSATQHLDFDLELAKRQSNENPVYYVQYAHARCSSILRQATERGVAVERCTDCLPRLVHPAEQTLMKKLIQLPEIVEDGARRRETHELAHYCLELATVFSAFYRDCRVLTDDAELSGARLQLVQASRQVLANALAMMEITAPETM